MELLMLKHFVSELLLSFRVSSCINLSKLTKRYSNFRNLFNLTEIYELKFRKLLEDIHKSWSSKILPRNARNSSMKFSKHLPEVLKISLKFLIVLRILIEFEISMKFAEYLQRSLYFLENLRTCPKFLNLFRYYRNSL